MTITGFFLLVVIIGFGIWLAIKFVPMPAAFQKLLIIFACVVVVVLFLKVIGFWPINLGNMPRLGK